MDGIHDLGGKQGFGAVETVDEKLGFSERWHASVFASVNALFRAGVINNTDQFRHAIERIDPVHYLRDGYYGRWLGGIENLLVEADAIEQAELDQRVAGLGGEPQQKAARPSHAPADFSAMPAAAGGARRQLQRTAKFAAGDQVRIKAEKNSGHTRLPGYLRGCHGQVLSVHDAWVFPDDAAHGYGENPQYLYTVVCQGEAIYGAEAEPGMELCIDLFEPYLESFVHES